MEISTLLNSYPFVKGWDVIYLKRTHEALHLKMKIYFSDGCELHTNEYVAFNTRKYAFHFQDKAMNMLMRWDNAPHHKEIDTYPFHLHNGKQVMPSSAMQLKDILEYLKKVFYEHT